jgi:hypothetical protein
LAFVALSLLFLGCNSGGDSGNLSQQTTFSSAREEEVVKSLLNVYQTALRQEDIDRLQELLPMEEIQSQARIQAQAEDEHWLEAKEFREAIAEVFRAHTVTSFMIPAATIRLDPERRQATFQEVETVEDPAAFMQRTRVFHTTFDLRRDEDGRIVTFRIARVRREGPLFEIDTLGQVLAETATRVIVRIPPETPQPTAVTVQVAGQQEQTLTGATGFFHGAFLPPPQSGRQTLLVRILRDDQSAMVIEHPYRVRTQDEQVVQQIAGTEGSRFFAVAVARDGTVWAGSDGGGRVFRVSPEATAATLEQRLLANHAGRVEDIVIDARKRVHFLFVDVVRGDVVGNGDIVLAQDVLCQTVDFSDPNYPLQALDPETGIVGPSVSTRGVAADAGDIWLFGSDGGVARVSDTFQGDSCSKGAIAVHYDPVFRREGEQDETALLSNTVPAFVASADGTLVFGTALGFTRRQENAAFVPVPFNRRLSLPENPATLEQFFQQVATAIFEAQPLVTAGIRGVSFQELFGARLIKEDIIFSAVEEAPGRFWVGTLGGGMRRIERHDGELRDTVQLTRAEAVQMDPDTGRSRGVSRHGIGRISSSPWRRGRRTRHGPQPRKGSAEFASPMVSSPLPISPPSMDWPYRCETWQWMPKAPYGWQRTAGYFASVGKANRYTVLYGTPRESRSTGRISRFQEHLFEQ